MWLRLWAVASELPSGLRNAYVALCSCCTQSSRAVSKVVLSSALLVACRWKSDILPLLLILRRVFVVAGTALDAEGVLQCGRRIRVGRGKLCWSCTGRLFCRLRILMVPREQRQCENRMLRVLRSELRLPNIDSRSRC